MKLTQQQEKELMQVYNTWWKSYLNGDLKTYNSFLDDDFRFVGSTEGEEFLDRKDTSAFFEATADQFAGKAKLDNVIRTIEPLEGMVLITDLADTFILNDNEWVYYARFRFTSLLRNTKNGWRFFYQHFSTPDLKAQEGETLGLERITQENQNLRDAIKRRTTELELKNRDLEIEASLERVRGRTMAMLKSEELKEVIQVVYDQFIHLNIQIEHTGFIMDYKAKDDMHIWLADEHGVPSQVTIPYFDSAHWNSFNEAKEKGMDFFDNKLTFAEKNSFYKKLLKHIPELPEEAKEFYLNCPGLAISTVLLENVGLYIENFSGIPYTDVENNTLMRFGKVFQQTYTRFIDLQKAEKQTREAQIETSLERLRSGTMAMHKSEDLLTNANLLYHEFRYLGITQYFTCGFIIVDEENSVQHVWVTNMDGEIFENFKLPLIGDPVFQQRYEKWQQKVPVFYQKVGGTKLKKHLAFAIPHFGSEEAEDMVANQFPDPTYFYMANFSHGYLHIVGDSKLTDEEEELLARFMRVFEQTYTRFLDLQKAEAQAREAKIETALEKVRSRTMAMRHSDELPEAANVLFIEVQELGIPAWSAGYCIWEEDKKYTSCNMSTEGVIQKSFTLPSIGEGYNFYDPVQQGETFYVAELGGEKLVKHYDFMKTLPIVGETLEEFEKEGIALPTYQIFHIVYFKHGYLMFITYESVQNQWGIFKRFGNVFEQTYTRFLDLQKAEEQTRESQIELGLERVRAKAMAMQKSIELAELVDTLIIELTKLDFSLKLCIINIIDEADRSNTVWATNPETGKDPEPYYLKFEDYPFHHAMWNAWKKRKRKWVYTIEENEKEIYDEYLFDESEFRRFSKNNQKTFRALKRYVNSFTFSDFGGLQTVGDEALSDENLDILARFGKVFDLTYTRFNDLKKSEKQTRQAQINLAVERVRAKALAMHKSDEIMEVVAKLKDEVMNLDIPDVVAATIFLNEGNDKIRMWDLSSLEKLDDGFQVHLDITFKLKKTDPHLYVKRVWENQENYFVEVQDEKGFKRIMAWLREHNKNQVADEVEEFIETTQLKQLYHATKKLNNGKLCIDLLKPPSDEMETILTKMGAAFDLAYKRFEDLQKAEEQTREAKIEAALEKVRSRSLAMHNTLELQEVVTVVAEKLQELGVILDSGGLVMCTYFPDSKDVMHWTATFDSAHPSVPYFLPYFDTPIFVETWASKNNGDAFFEKVFSYEVKNDFFNKAFEISDYKNLPAEYKKLILDAESHCLSFAWSKNSALMIPSNTGMLLPEEHKVILTRFAKVFEQAFIRFLDLQKAESQAKEALIEVALERIRAKVTAMKVSADLLDIVVTMRSEFVKLGHEAHYFWHMRWLPDTYEKAMTSGDGTRIGNVMELPRGFHENAAMTKWENNKVPVAIFPYDAEGAVDYVDKMIRLGNFQEIDHNTPEPDDIRAIGGITFVMARTTHGEIGYSLPGIVKNPPAEDLDILVRFATAFDLAHKRFEDLRQSEIQTRETQIELSLERVRSKTMAMHNSQDVKDAVITLFTEILKQNDDASLRCGIGILSKSEEMEVWTASYDSNKVVGIDYGTMNMNLHALLRGVKKAWISKKDSFFYKLSGKDLLSYFKILNDTEDYTFHTDTASLSNEVFHNSFMFSEGVLFAFTTKPLPESTLQVFKRFAIVFEQTYTRYLDLQKAEAQAKEAQIEASLERVRSKAMAMHSSEDLITTASQLFKEFQYLDISFIRCGVLKINENKTGEVYSYSLTKENEAVAVYGDINLSGHEFMDEVFSHWKLQKDHVHELNGEAVKHYYQLVSKQINMPKVKLSKSNFAYAFYFPEGCLYCFTNEKLSEEVLRILRKFNTVMGLTYRRYFELQEAEARELAAIKESSLDRVRAEIASMRTANDLNRITPLVWKELTTLGVPFFRCGVFIIDDQTQKVHAYLSTPSGDTLAALELEFDSMPLVKGVVSHWKQQKVYVEKWNKDQFIEFTQPLIEQGQINSSKNYQGGLEAPEQLVLQMVPFKQGMLYVGSEDSLTNDHISMVESLAMAFSIAYTRYEDFRELEAAKGHAEDTLSELKATQTQLIQSEKMASLGELTAGIAHEIQNPLNFVNNFSELSEEMLEELEEEINETSDGIVTEIMTDLKQNLNKITNHGKRASSIVKGMLEHSRTGSGTRELTDINKLADEYLRLSYHGLRAKNKSFNADFITDFDESLPRIEIIAQDLGRVILNLINNAFYACTERNRSTSEQSRSNTGKDYKPIVTVSTKKIGDKVEIRVKDNGSGIPGDIKEKIFQPFFTTKPTGSGTGLGLSLAYDIIVKGHSGELAMTTKEGKGTEFTIHLPLELHA